MCTKTPHGIIPAEARYHLERGVEASGEARNKYTLYNNPTGTLSSCDDIDLARIRPVLQNDEAKAGCLQHRVGISLHRQLGPAEAHDGVIPAWAR